MKCTVCNHPRSHDIDLAILSGNYTLSELEHLFGPSRSAFWRHKNHLEQKISRAQVRLEKNVRLAYLFKLNGLLQEASDTIKTSQEEGNSRLRLQAINTSARLVQAINKMGVSLDRATVYRLLTSPQGPRSECFLPVDPRILDDNFRALTLGLLFPCPETAPRNLEDPEDMAEEPKDSEAVPAGRANADAEDGLAAAPEVASRLSPAQTRELADFLAQAALLPAPPVAGTPARRQRDKGATKTVQTAPRVKQSLQKQSVKKDDGNLAPDAGASPAAPQKTAAGHRKPASRNQKLKTPPEAGNQKPETDPAAPPQTTAHCPLPTDHCIKDRFAGYFKFPGDYPPGYLHAMTHGYWPDDPPEHIPDRRWEEDFGLANRFGKTKGAY